MCTIDLFLGALALLQGLSGTKPDSVRFPAKADTWDVEIYPKWTIR